MDRSPNGETLIPRTTMSKYTFQIQPNPALAPIKERIKTQPWSADALFPTEAKRRKMQPAKKVFCVLRGDRRFAVVAKDFVEADHQITNL